MPTPVFKDRSHPRHVFDVFTEASQTNVCAQQQCVDVGFVSNLEIGRATRKVIALSIEIYLEFGIWKGNAQSNGAKIWNFPGSGSRGPKAGIKIWPQKGLFRHPIHHLRDRPGRQGAQPHVLGLLLRLCHPPDPHRDSRGSHLRCLKMVCTPKFI